MVDSATALLEDTQVYGVGWTRPENIENTEGNHKTATKDRRPNTTVISNGNASLQRPPVSMGPPLHWRAYAGEEGGET